ncbi:hypothetical protein [Ectopseudomonas oleovorans]|uniref:Uncharacterized protein n=1 Tax=Ectopseudomonas oleovorans TaxID=301 RepID=A0AA42TVC3_ECTOL|nr:hypothetical protein [Pseudomonas oleovorans]MDH1341117.1 hypothetical protein [Pseudomonas oleovorans]MDH1494223.1 hypothetical protein [Pseudomonas oleovorans]WGG22932.1 hypothetical protein N5O83_10000 [Pseudomonas oleovorans]
MIYHEIDFLLPAQRFNINFSYITQKGLPFVREFVLRLIHLAPMSKSQVATFFGFTPKEAQEAIEDLVERGELTLSESGRLMLTEKSNGYFTEIGEIPRLSLLRDTTACLSFDLATFTCLGKDISSDKWKSGISLKVDDQSASCSETLVEKHFQRQFQRILHSGFLPRSLVQDEKESPTVYTVNSVSKIRQMPFRLPVQFKIDAEGRSVEREDFEMLKSSDYVHAQISLELARLTRPSNFGEIAKAMLDIGDSDTLKLFDSKGSSISLQFFEDLAKLEANSQKKRTTFLGSIYSSENWELFQKYMSPVIKARRESKSGAGETPLIWIAPSDPYWGKSNRALERIGQIFDMASTKQRKLYSPAIYLPIAGPDDQKGVRQWKWELSSSLDKAHGLIEGFLGGNVEIIYFEGEFVVVVYHVSLPENYPVSVPLGFISADKDFVSRVGRLVIEYLSGSSGFDRNNDCGLLSRLGASG